ncbi:MAG: biotin transporter BioY [Acholeplasmatales bacterium]|nr:biotin transporter BioY [Acholeplasmatales bacterium]
MKVKDLVYIAIFTSIICVMSLISIPTTVPFTLQTMAIFLCMFMLKPVDSLISVLIYITIGIIGIPVFSNFKSGIGVIAGPTGGYILGFILMTLVPFIIKNKIASAIIGLIICYTFGSIWFLFFNQSNITSIWKVLTICVLPFIIPDGVKLALAYILSLRLKFLTSDETNNKNIESKKNEEIE